MTWPSLSILIITYKRADLAIQEIEALNKNLKYSGPWHWHIADDGSGQEYIDRLGLAIKENTEKYRGGIEEAITYTVTNRLGAGANMNAGQRVCWSKSDFILWLEDDWRLRYELDLHPMVKLLTDHVNVCMIRLGYMQRGMVGETVSGANELWWLLSKKSPDHYILAGHASLRHRRLYDIYGEYTEGLRAGDTESDFCFKFNNKAGPDVVWPAYLGCWGPFEHIGGVSLKDVLPGTEI